MTTDIQARQTSSAFQPPGSDCAIRKHIVRAIEKPYLASYSAHDLPLVLGMAAAVLIVLHIAIMAVYWLDIVPPDIHDLKWWEVAIFDLDTEESFGTWFSAVLLLVTGRFLWQQARYLESKADRWTKWWLMLAIGFHLMSLDEVVGMHEYLNTMMQRYGSEEAKWTSVGGPLAVLIGLAFVPWLLSLPRRTRWTFVVGGALFFSGAVGVEGATEVYKVWNKLNTFEYHMWIALEEGLEMFGVIIFLRGLLHHMAREVGVLPAPVIIADNSAGPGHLNAASSTFATRTRTPQ